MLLCQKHLSEDQLSLGVPVQAQLAPLSPLNDPSLAIGLMLPSLLSARVTSPCHPRQCQWLHLCIHTPPDPMLLGEQGKGDPCSEDSIIPRAGKGCYTAGSSRERPAELLSYSVDKSRRERDSPRGWSPPFCPTSWASLEDGPACAADAAPVLALHWEMEHGVASGLLLFPMNYKPQLGHLTCQTVMQA